MSDRFNKAKQRYLPICESVLLGLESEAKITDFIIIKGMGNQTISSERPFNVYHIKHKKTQVEYAVKAFAKRFIQYNEESPFFKKGIEVIYNIHHPNIIKTFGHFEDNNYCYFITEFFNKGNVYNLPKDKKKRISEQNCASIIKDVICGVYFLHNMKPPIIHGNIAPENVLLSEGLVAKINDYAWNSYSQNVKKINYKCWTPIYFPPEILKGQEYNEALDIWCIGVLLFELLTSEVPFKGNDIDTVKNNIFKVKISWPKDINIDAKDLIEKILKKNPKERISLEDMIKHPFITKYFPDAEKNLIKPEEGVKYKPFVICKDDPKTWKLEKI